MILDDLRVFEIPNDTFKVQPRPVAVVPRMDELYVYDRALTARESRQHIADGK